MKKYNRLEALIVARNFYTGVNMPCMRTGETTAVFCLAAPAARGGKGGGGKRRAGLPGCCSKKVYKFDIVEKAKESGYAGFQEARRRKPPPHGCTMPGRLKKQDTQQKAGRGKRGVFAGCAAGRRKRSERRWDF